MVFDIGYQPPSARGPARERRQPGSAQREPSGSGRQLAPSRRDLGWTSRQPSAMTTRHLQGADAPTGPAMMAAYATADGAHRVRQGRGDARRRARRPPRLGAGRRVRPHRRGRAGVRVALRGRGVHRRRDDGARGRRPGRLACARPIRSTPTRSRPRPRTAPTSSSRSRSRRRSPTAIARSRPVPRPASGWASISQRRFYPPIVRMKAAIDAGRIGRAGPRDRRHPRLARRRLLRLEPMARDVGGRGRRGARQPGAPPARPPAVVHGADRGALRLLGQPQPPVDPGRRHGGRGHPVPERRAGRGRREQLAAPGDRRPPPRPRVERGVGRDPDGHGLDVHLRGHRDGRAGGQRPLDHRGRGRSPAGMAGRGPRLRRGPRSDVLVPRAPDRGLPRRDRRGSPAGSRWGRGTQGRGAVHGDLPLAARPPAGLVPAGAGGGPGRPRRAARGATGGGRSAR